MTIEPLNIVFEPLTARDLPLLHQWLACPHVAKWWGPTPSLAEVEEDFLPSIAGTIAHHCYLAIRDAAPVGFIASYAPADWHHEGWWLDQHDPDVRGIDQFLAHSDQLDQGLGTAMIRTFVARLFADPAVNRVQTDPSPANRRAIRCYEKAGFRPVREIDTPDGRALLMVADRPAHTQR